MKNFTLNLKMYGCLAVCIVFMSFSIHTLLDEETTFIQKTLIDHYDDQAESPQLKRYELNVTNTGFCRYKRYLKNGKVEYFSFNLVKFKDIDYLGSDVKGKLYLHTKGEDVIVQTYNDKDGDVDSMADYMVIPMKSVEAETLNELSARLVRMNALLLAQK